MFARKHTVFMNKPLKAILLICLGYFITVGFTWHTLYDYQLRWVNLLVLSLFLLRLWLDVRQMPIKFTPLVGLLGMWWGIVLLSAVFNLESWRRISIGVWMLLLYTVFILLLQSAFLKRSLQPRDLLWMLLGIFGLQVVTVGQQILPFLRHLTWGVNIIEQADKFGVFISGTLSNPNLLGAFCVLTLPFLVVGVGLHPARAWQRVLFALFSLLAFLLLLLSLSIGAWVSVAVEIPVGLVLWLNYQYPNGWSKWRQRWRNLSQALRFSLLGILGIFTVLLGSIAVFAWGSVAAIGGSFLYRRYLIENVLHTFVESPWIGTGLFTVQQALIARGTVPWGNLDGQTLEWLNNLNHSHNSFINVLVELGVAGAIGYGITIVVLGWASRLAWRTASPQHKLMLIASITAWVGISVHHHVDVTSLTPAIGILIMIVMLVMMPQDPSPRRSFRLPVFIPLASCVLLVGMGWDSMQLQAQTNTIWNLPDTFDVRTLAQQVERLEANDPAMPGHALGVGLLYGIDHYQTQSRASLDQAIAAYERVVTREPNQSYAWTNLAVLYAERGDVEQAQTAYAHSQRLAQHVVIITDLADIPNALTREYYATIPRVLDGQADGVVLSAPPQTPIEQAIMSLIETEQGQTEAARARIDAILPFSTLDIAWKTAADAWLLRTQSKPFDALLARISPPAPTDLFYQDGIFAANYSASGFYRLQFARQYVPHLNFPLTDPMIRLVVADLTAP